MKTLAALIMGCALSGSASAQLPAPVVTSFQVGGGAFNTAERVVSVYLTASGSPTAMRISENSDMSGAVWKSFSASSSFTLSSEPGWKKVYVQVGRAPTLSTDLSRTIDPTITRTISYVVTPTVLSGIVGDTIVLGLPDLRSKVIMPASVKDNQTFDFEVQVSNAGQSTPAGQRINVYNSFVTNSISLERVEVPFMLQNLVGDGCVFTDVPTIECTLAPMPPGRVVSIQIHARVTRALTSTQTSVTHTLRTRIVPIQESNTSNNWRDTPLVIVKP